MAEFRVIYHLFTHQNTHTHTHIENINECETLIYGGYKEQNKEGLCYDDNKVTNL